MPKLLRLDPSPCKLVAVYLPIPTLEALDAFILEERYISRSDAIIALMARGLGLPEPPSHRNPLLAPDDGTITRQQAIERLGVSEPQFVRLLREHPITPLRIGNRMWFRESDVQALAVVNATKKRKPRRGVKRYPRRSSR